MNEVGLLSMHVPCMSSLMSLSNKTYIYDLSCWTTKQLISFLSIHLGSQEKPRAKEAESLETEEKEEKKEIELESLGIKVRM